jgi:hypothetical protein
MLFQQRRQPFGCEVETALLKLALGYCKDEMLGLVWEVGGI